MQTLPSITWDTLYNELFVFVSRKVRDKSAAEDIVQDVFIKVHTKSHQIEEAEKISGWIFQVTRNAIADHFRKNFKVLEPVNTNWENDSQELNDCVAYCLNLLMKSMPEKYRIALELTEIQNLSQFELSEKLNISHSGARSRVQRARKMLKEKIDELYMIKTDSYGNVITCEDRVPCCCKHGC
jgi:RNA polymerase sigma-70 factor, ECF subfamily